jgi:hypothetical protein
LGVDRVSVTLELDSRVEIAIRRRARNLGISESEFVNRTLHECLDLGVLDELRGRPPTDLTDDEVSDIVQAEIDAYRRERDGDDPRPRR